MNDILKLLFEVVSCIILTILFCITIAFFKL